MPPGEQPGHRLRTGGPWGTGLLLLSIASITLGVGYLARPMRDIPPALRGLISPMWLWSLLWILAGAFGIWKSLRPPQRPGYLAPFAGLTFLWAAAYLIHWLIGGLHGTWDSSWTGTVVWATFGALIICWGGKCINPPRQ